MKTAAWLGILTSTGTLVAFAIQDAAMKSPPGTEPPSPPTIILITLDTLRADHLGCYGYFRPTSPNLDALARESVVFDRADAPMATTFPSHLSLLTGVYPSEHGYLSNTRLIDTAFEPTPNLRSVTQILRDMGYTTAAFVSAAPVRDTTGLGAGFDSYNQPQKDDWRIAGTRPAEQTANAFLEWFNHTPREPFFAWIHFFDPHWPYEPPAPYDAWFTTDDALRAWVEERRCTKRFPNKWKTRDVFDIHNAYDGEIRYMDEHIGRVLAALRETGRLDRCVLIVTADHGEGLGQHDWPAHGDLHAEQIHIPLMIRFPPTLGIKPARIASVVSLVDVFPTVLARIGSPAAAIFQKQATGEDVLDPRFSRRFVFSERADHNEGWSSGRRFALTDDRYRFYHLTEHEDELYDLAADPHELHNLAADHPRVAAAMRKELLARLAGYQKRALVLARERKAPSRPPDERMKRDLKALGYIESQDEDDQTSPSPKTRSNAGPPRP